MSEESNTDANKAVETASNTSGTGGANSVEALEPWAQKLIRDTRSEAADYRTRLRQESEAKEAAVKQLEELKTQHQTLTDELGIAKLGSAKVQVALEAGLGGDQALLFADRLRGNTVEELKADAEQALKLFNTTARTSATDPTQGLGSAPKPTTEQIMGDFFAQQLGINTN